MFRSSAKIFCPSTSAGVEDNFDDPPVVLEPILDRLVLI